jgi:hypothetical protein
MDARLEIYEELSTLLTQLHGALHGAHTVIEFAENKTATGAADVPVCALCG